MHGSYQRLEKCRLSGSRNLISVLHLGEQELTGVFPHPDEAVTRGRGQPREVRGYHFSDPRPDRLGGRGHEAGLSAGPALALQGQQPPTRTGVYRQDGKFIFPFPGIEII